MTSLDQAVATQMQKRIAAMTVKATEVLTEGTCKDFTEYRYAIGYLQCLRDMETITNEILDDIRRG